MSKYGAIIAEARKPENIGIENQILEQANNELSNLELNTQKVKIPDNKNTKKPINQQTAKPANSKTSKQQNQQTAKPANSRQQSVQSIQSVVDMPLTEREEEVNLSVKVALRRRRHWASQAKLKGETLTEIITSALLERYGEPQ